MRMDASHGHGELVMVPLACVVQGHGGDEDYGVMDADDGVDHHDRASLSLGGDGRAHVPVACSIVHEDYDGADQGACLQTRQVEEDPHGDGP
mmetsp:Transcript_6357/g.14355  ORF Transcript_6357/g.14355 Transcript_6357/m.14355 type:complete len:92 (-) Transcript_6357:163-438(-)